MCWSLELFHDDNIWHASHPLIIFIWDEQKLEFSCKKIKWNYENPPTQTEAFSVEAETDRRVFLEFTETVVALRTLREINARSLRGRLSARIAMNLLLLLQSIRRIFFLSFLSLIRKKNSSSASFRKVSSYFTLNEFYHIKFFLKGAWGVEAFWDFFSLM